MVEGICHLDRENIEEYRMEKGYDFLPAADLLPAANIPAVKLMARSIFARSFPGSYRKNNGQINHGKKKELSQMGTAELVRGERFIANRF
jgi:hypothetical protein